MSVSPVASNRSPAFSYSTLAAVLLFWSGNMIVGRAVSGLIPPFTFAFVRWAGAALLVLPFAWPHFRRELPILRQHWKAVLFLGATGIACFNALIYTGLQYTTATNALLLQAAIPAIVMLFDRIFFGQNSSILRMIGVILSMAGVAVIVLRGELAGASALAFDIGDIFVLAAVLSWAFYTSFLRLRPDCHPLAFLFATFLIGIAAMAPLAFWELVEQEKTVLISPGTVAAFIYVASFPSLIAYMLYNAAVRNLGPVPAGQAITLMPLFGAFLAALLLGEKLHQFHFAGMALILLGIALSARGALSR